MAKSVNFNPELVDDLARRRVVLFVGAGASNFAQPLSGGKFKKWAEFLNAACSHIKIKTVKELIKGCIAKRDFLIASELLKIHLKEEWRALLNEEFQKKAEPSRLHAALFNLDQRIIVTTNFDKVIETAWSESRCTRHPTVCSHIDQNTFRLFRDDNSYLIKLHGSIDNPDSIVFDKSSYQDKAYSNIFYQEFLKTLLLSYTFLFVGFSMDDPAISLVVETHAYKYKTSRPHYIFLPGKSTQVDDLTKELRKLYVIRYSPRANHVMLAEMLEKLGDEMREKQRLNASQVCVAP